MDKQIKRIIKDNPTLDGAETITVTVTREDRTRHHYYITKKKTNDDYKTVTIPISVLAKENGKGKNKHYVVVVVDELGNYKAYNLNKPRKTQIEGYNAVIDDPDEMGYITNNKEPLPF